jgi:hypothetical protein
MWESKTLQGRNAYDLETPDVDKIESSAWPRAGEIFPETSGFMMAIQVQVTTTKNYKKHILHGPEHYW